MFLSLFLALTVQAAEPVTWTETAKVHPLWAAFQIMPIPVEHDFLDIQAKGAGGVTCHKIVLWGATPMQPTQIQYHCSFPAEMTPEQVRNLYDNVRAPVIDMSNLGEAKVIGRMIIVKDDDQSRLYLEHPCRNVQTKSNAKACMRFWAQKVLPSYEGANDYKVVKANKKTRAHLAQVLDWEGNPERKKILGAYDYFGMVAQYQDENQFLYFGLQKGTNETPYLIHRFSVVDVEYSPLGEELQRLAKDDDAYPELENRVYTSLFLGTDPSFFEEIMDSLVETLDELRERANDYLN